MGFSADNACHIQGQAALIISSYQRFCPVTYEAVRSARLGKRLLEIVAQWLRSFFCAGFDPKRQSLQSLSNFWMRYCRVHQSDLYRLLVASNTKTLAELESLASIKVRKEFFLQMNSRCRYGPQMIWWHFL